MTTEIDEGRGLVKTCWQNIRSRVAQVEPEFAKIVDELDPDKSFPMYLVYLPYGALKGDTQSSFIPKQEGGYYRLSDPNAPKDVIKHLGYGKDSSPLGMVLEKELEYFIDLKSEGITIPSSIYSPGAFFPLSRALGRKSTRNYAPNGLLTVTSGVRSTFMLPNIGCVTNHVNIQRDLNIKTPAAKSLYEQWHIFSEIANSPAVDCDWRSCLIYFSEKWLTALHNNKAWLKLKLYLQEVGWRNSEYLRNHFFYDSMFSIVQRQGNLKPNPYLADTARHLFTIALGEAPGYAPACDENSLPLSLIQKVFSQSYGLKKYIPTVIQPSVFRFEKAANPIYYSLQNPTTFVFSPKSRKLSSTLFEMRELQHIVERFSAELSNNDSIFSDTIISEVAQGVEFNYYHNQLDKHNVIKPSKEMEEADKRFQYCASKKYSNGGIFSGDSQFVRGCISIRKLS